MPAPLCKNRRQSSWRTAMVSVELALTLPLLVFLLFAFYELARANLMRNLAQDAAYEAAREIIVAGAHADEAGAVAGDMLQIFGIDSPQVTVSPSTISPTTEEVAVTVSFPMQTITGFGDNLLAGLIITGSCQLQREGFHQLPASSTTPPPGDDDEKDD